MTADTKKQNATIDPSGKIYKLWIHDQWYIPVDAEGRCVGVCGEGALGFIVQLLSTDDKERKVALKIPRMMAETHRENAYICGLLAQERAAVVQLFAESSNGQGINVAGLLTSHITLDPLRAPLTIRELRDEAINWHNALILVRFEKSQNPYFCLVKPGVDEPYPPKAKALRISNEQFKRIQELTVNQGMAGRYYAQTVFVTQPESDGNGQAGGEQPAASSLVAFNITEALSPEKKATAMTWYTCLPSVGYTWAPNTLQEAIGIRSRGETWSLKKHLRLVERLCSGVKALHDKNMLHADIRPANVVHLAGPENPESYFLSDYGSFATSHIFPISRSDAEPRGNTIIGPVVEGERTSAFYAPERQSGRERETADTAIVVPQQNVGTDYVLVGWKSEFQRFGLLDNRARPKRNADGFMKFIAQERERFKDQQAPDSALHKGDRIQLRDYIFELADREQVLGNMHLFECHDLYWTVYHGKIVINENNPFTECYTFPIPRVIELPQWSAATDIYSLGAISLYSVYSDYHSRGAANQGTESEEADKEEATLNNGAVQASSVQESGQPANQESLAEAEQLIEATHHPTSQVRRVRNLSGSDTLDKGFEAMLTYLADHSLFNAVWPRLEWLRGQIEEKLLEPGKWTAELLATAPFKPNPKLKQRTSDYDAEATANHNDTAQNEQNEKASNLKDETAKVISQITSTVPGIARLLEKQIVMLEGKPEVRYQLGPFVFFMHFVLRCLHRGENMDAEKQEWAKEAWMTVPFCRDRHEQTEKNEANGKRAVELAQERLEAILNIIDDGALQGLWSNQVAAFDLRPENELRQELEELRAESMVWGREKEQARASKTHLELAVKTLESERAALHDQLQEAHGEAQGLRQRNDARTTSINRALTRLQQATLAELLGNRRTVIQEIVGYLLETNVTPAQQKHEV
jgi:hypothetical protein